MAVIDEIKKYKLVPVVVFQTLVEVTPTISALVKGDLPVAEICFRTDCAANAIKIATTEFPDVLIGAGTVINAEQCEAAIKCGAKFIVSPGLSDSVDAVCKKHNIPYLPGVVTPTEIMHALELGRTTLKFFPAGEFGGLKALKSMSAAFPQVEFMPTGGVNNSNLHEFLEFKKIIACGGSWMCKGTPEQITETCLAARAIVKGE